MDKKDMFIKELFGEPRWIAMLENKNDLHCRSFSTKDLKRAIYIMLDNSSARKELGPSWLRDVMRGINREPHDRLIEIYNDFYKQIYKHDDYEIFLNYVWLEVAELREQDNLVAKFIKNNVDISTNDKQKD